MTAAFAAVFVASLLGSGHCAGMCGAFLAIAVAPLPGSLQRPDGGVALASRSPSRGRLLAAYNVGRLLTYSILGAAAGAIGAAVDLGGELVGVQRAATIAAGAFVLCFGIIALLRQFNLRLAHVRVPGFIRDMVIRVHRAADRLTPTTRAITIGAVTTLLPCGWLWAFVITAAGTGSPPVGAAVMGMFWLGTLPVMLALGAGVQSLAGRLGARLPVLTSLLLIGVGLSTVFGRLSAPAIAMPTTVRSATGSIVVPTGGASAGCPLCHPERSEHGR